MATLTVGECTGCGDCPEVGNAPDGGAIGALESATRGLRGLGERRVGVIGDSRQWMDGVRRLGAEPSEAIVYPDGRVVVRYLGGWERTLQLRPDVGRWMYGRVAEGRSIGINGVWLQLGAVR